MTYHITARDRNGNKVDLYYKSIYEAKKENPALTEFVIVGKSIY